MFVGIPGSGKTYFVEHLCQRLGLVHLSSDHMRKSMFGNPDRFERGVGNPMVFGAMDYAIQEILKAGHSVAYDSNHNFRTIRTKTREFAEALNAQVVLISIQAPLDVAVERATEREEDNYRRRIPADRVIHQSKTIELPGEDEKYIVIDGTAPFEEQFAAFESQL